MPVSAVCQNPGPKVYHKSGNPMPLCKSLVASRIITKVAGQFWSES